ncbi:isochorismatase family protein [Nocardioides sp. Root190]|uniref:isochorismatase family protein n=1 Tax=Nocardioides sp. Root190 TaxID=1736488 RepID=UPI000A4DFB99|nr:isochorismatase family protein [Nocardioides sp. Root190]
MSLPPSIDYATPDLADFPASRAGWELSPDRAAVLVHDLQLYFTRPYAPDCAAFLQTVRRTAQILRAARGAGIPVYYTAQRGNQDQQARGLQRDLWGPGMQAVPEHTDIIEAVAPAPGERVLVKHRYSAFAGNELAAELAAQGRDQLVITGVYAHIGIAATAMEAFQREVHPFVVGDAVADFGPEEHALALRQIASCCGVVVGADAVVSVFEAATVGSRRGPDTGVGTGIDDLVRAELVLHLGEEMAALTFTDAETDLFTLGLDSLRAFEVLDVLADAGVDVDFGAFTRRPTIGFLREQALAVAH